MTRSPPPEEGLDGRVVRFVTVNASLSPEKSGDLVRDLSTADTPRTRNVPGFVPRFRLTPAVARPDHRLADLDLAID